MNKKEFFTRVLENYKELNEKCDEGYRTGICFSIRQIYWMENEILRTIDTQFMDYFHKLFNVAEPTMCIGGYWWDSKDFDIRVKFLNKIINNEI